MESAGCSIIHAKNDADCLIVQNAVTSAQITDTVVVGDDTDLLVLLLHHADTDSKELFLAPEPKQSSTKAEYGVIKQCKAVLGPDVCDHILYIHAVLGCDTTF